MAVERKLEPREDLAFKPLFARRGTIQVATNHTPITSMTIDPKTRYMLTTWQAPTTGHNLHVMKLAGEEVGNDRFSGPDSYVHGMFSCVHINQSIWA
jgi:hypothetical protein